MKLFVLEEFDGYEASSVAGVFSTQSLADEALARIGGPNSGVIREFVLNQLPERRGGDRG